MLEMLFRRSLADRPAVATITPAELHQKLSASEQLLVLDVRSAEEYAYDGHVAGSRLLPLPVLLQRSAELPKDRPIMIICRSGNRSHTAAEQLLAQGFREVYNVVGGMIAWRRAGLPIS